MSKTKWTDEHVQEDFIRNTMKMLFGDGPHMNVATSHMLRLIKDAQEPYQELLEDMWSVIANASNGDWSKQTDEWVTAARRLEKIWIDLPPRLSAHEETPTPEDVGETTNKDV